MSRPLKFTFKTIHPTGKHRKLGKTSYIVKLKKEQVGLITSEPPYMVMLGVYKGLYKDDVPEEDREWHVVDFDKRFDSVDEAKFWLNENAEEIIKKYIFKKS